MDIYEASKKGKLRRVKGLIKGGANVNVEIEESSPLGIAAKNGHLGIVKELIKAGADVNSRNGVDFTPLLEAADNGHLEIVKELIEAGANIDHNSQLYENTALMLAVMINDMSMTKTLIEAGADPFQINEYGRFYWFEIGKN